MVCRAGTAALVSFAFGASVETGSIQQPLLAAAAMACLMLGICLITWSGRLQQQAVTPAALRHASAADAVFTDGGRAAQGSNLQLDEGGLEVPLLSRAPASLSAAAAGGGDGGSGSQQQWLGAGFAVITGLMGGLVLAPMDFVPYECRGLPYMSGLATGVAVAAVVATYLVEWLTKHKVRLCRMDGSERLMLQLDSDHVGFSPSDDTGVVITTESR
jgi:hypothetical protein